ncbi:MAG: hypothetical protein EOS20_17320 [Mesorhizobium sp.]|uniref:hypothetical protein n=1 Tax=Mesorhizobium sp. TaxID=1871066 RepID=UPI000FE62B90|nr:hypothetical protein [Mesorhizobium sp.]RWQ35834.1 MAG: hypothetical protein EOS20_17320 [Mesorhizobium sp.]
MNATQYYLTGTVHMLRSEREARTMSTNAKPSVVRQDRDGTWNVYFLDTKPRQKGQSPFMLRKGEAA